MRYIILLITIQILSLNIFSQIVNETEIKSKLKKASNNQAFIENKGQWNDEVLYLSKVNGANVWITKSGVVYDYFQMELVEQDTSQSLLDKKLQRFDRRRDTQPNYNICGHIFKMELQNGNQEPTSNGVGKKETYYNYFLGNDKSKWASNVSLYNEVIVEDLYEGISARYYYEGNSIRYDYIADAGADISQIRMNYDGQDDITVNSLGELLIQTSLGEIKHNKIYAYQEIDNQKIEIKCKFKQNSESQFSFELGEYNKDFTLVIDPIVWSTFIGGSDNDISNCIVLDEEDNIYIAGSTVSKNYPTSKGAYDISYQIGTVSGSTDVFVSKLSSEGSTLLYSTYIGGGDNDKAFGIALDKSSNIYISGNTRNDKILYPTTKGAFNETISGDYDCFISKLSSDGSELLYSTIIGGNKFDAPWGICLDKSNNVYITGITNSNNYPVSNNAYQKIYNDGLNSSRLDIFISKLSSDGSRLLFSTYLGSDGDDWSSGICLDESNNIYIVGQTYQEGVSSNMKSYPTTKNAYDNNRYNNSKSAVISKLSSDGSKLLFSTYLGGNDWDSGSAICLDSYSNVYVAGRTSSINFPTTKNAFDDSYNQKNTDEGNDLFVSKLSSDGSRLLYSTFIGGNDDEYISGICIDNSNNLYLTGTTSSFDFPLTESLNDELKNDNALFVSKLSANGNSLLYSAIFLLGQGDYPSAIELDNSKNVCLTGRSSIPDFLTTIGAYDDTYNGYIDSFLFKLDLTISGVHSNQNRDFELDIIYEGSDIFAKFNSKTINSELRIFSLDGALISSKIIDNSVGNNRVNLKANELKSGTYIVQIISGQEIYSEKFVVAK